MPFKKKYEHEHSYQVRLLCREQVCVFPRSSDVNSPPFITLCDWLCVCVCGVCVCVCEREWVRARERERKWDINLMVDEARETILNSYNSVDKKTKSKLYIYKIE